MKVYKSTGVVWGHNWGGGQSGYKAEPLQAKTLKKLLKENNEMLEDGSLDSGMGFESLYGAVLDIEEVETITKNGKEYSRSEYFIETIGEVSEVEVDISMQT